MNLFKMFIAESETQSMELEYISIDHNSIESAASSNMNEVNATLTMNYSGTVEIPDNAFVVDAVLTYYIEHADDDWGDNVGRINTWPVPVLHSCTGTLSRTHQGNYQLLQLDSTMIAQLENELGQWLSATDVVQEISKSSVWKDFEKYIENRGYEHDD